MRFRMLGPLLVRKGAGWVPVPADQQRVVLAVLLADAGRPVSTERLVDAVWGDRPPRRAVNTVQAYVMRLRRLLGVDALAARGHGYELVAGPDDVDASVFERLVAAGRRELDEGRAEAGVARLAKAVALWRGPVFADVAASPSLTSRVAHLEQVRLAAEEDHVAALLDLNRHVHVVDALHRLVEESPLRERRWALLMRALDRCGRRAEALEAFHRARRVLRDELGLEPGSELRALQRTILTEDPPEELRPDRGEATAVVISAIEGTPAVGMTALAVRWAHRAQDLSGDGQLHVNLRGYADGPPVRPVDTLATFLHALGVPSEQISSDADEVGALYRSLLAGKQVLVVLDNARDPD